MLTRSHTKDGAALFDRAVQVIHGDIGYLCEIDGKALDALAFPTHSHLSNNGIGAAAVVHRRAGPQLDAYLRSPMAGNLASRGLATGEVVVTPAFNANVNKLIHCVGPRVTNPDCERLLERTYESLMSAVAHDGLKCVAIASISTGNLGVAAVDGARVAMRVLQRFLRAHHGWCGAVAFVCFERDVFDAFAAEKRRVQFHS
ncbi:hypothetical protein PybrP1_002728 [[Pythium] brassicae (nom. inval.)]|nr:hypothetical protein PybrP1_002728 [[Pythium] brassicae (nom. inval.)]